MVRLGIGSGKYWFYLGRDNSMNFLIALDWDSGSWDLSLLCPWPVGAVRGITVGSRLRFSDRKFSLVADLLTSLSGVEKNVIKQIAYMLPTCSTEVQVTSCHRHVMGSR